MDSDVTSRSGWTCRGRIVGAVAVAMFLTAGCEQKNATNQTKAPTTENAAGATPLVCTTFYPLTYFAERIGGDAIQVECPYPADEDAAFWVPDAEAVQKFQAADLILVNGATFEKGLAKVSLPESRVVDTAAGFKDRFIEFAGAVMHSHGPGGAHTHTGTDGHTWVDPLNAKLQAGAVKDALVARLPAHQAQFEAGYAELARDLDALDGRFWELTAKIGDRLLVCSHPAYNYVGQRYDWPLRSFHFDPEVVPEPDELSDLQACVEEHHPRVLLWEGAPSGEVVAAFADLGLTHVVFSPGESLDAETAGGGGDYLTIMNANLDRLSTALEAIEAATPSSAG